MSTKRKQATADEANMIAAFLIMEGMEIDASVDKDTVGEKLKAPLGEVIEAYPDIERIQLHGLFCYAIGTVQERRRWHAREREAGRNPHVDVHDVSAVLEEIAQDYRQHRKRKRSESVRSKQRRKKARA
jgi:hypothetical protein